MIELKLLGQAELRGSDGFLEHSFLAGPKRLSLLAFLVLNRPKGFQRRDKILPMLWPEKGQKNARNSLSNLLYHIRKALGGDIIVTRGTEELGIDTSKLKCDAFEFEKLIEAGKMLDAIEIYRGALLEGLHVADASSDFDQWLERERERFRDSYGKAIESLAAEAEKRGELKEAAKWWRIRVQSAPFETYAVKRLVELLNASGNRAAALRKASLHADYLHKEMGIDPDETMKILTVDLNKVSIKTPGINTYPAKPLDHADFKSVAILPFEELGNSEQTSNFASGLHNDLLTRLSTVSDLTVISRTSVLHYQKSEKSVPDIARELGAGTIIEGSIQFQSGRVRLNIQLIDGTIDKHIWAETYDRILTAEHIFDIQTELALKITDSLKARLTPLEKKRIVNWAPTDNIEAYRLYSYGRRHLDQRTSKGMERAEEYFRRAVEQDPNYATAWTGLADALVLQYDYGHRVSDTILHEAEAAIHRAIKLDPELPEAYASLGLLDSNKHRGSAAIQALKRAVELQPSYAEAHNWLSWNYQLLGKPAKALESAKKAVTLNPLSPEAVSNLSFSYLQNGYAEEALEEALRGVELQPDWGTPVFYQAMALFYLEKYSEAISILKDLSVPWAGNGPLATLALCHISAGNIKEADKIYDRLKQNGDLFASGLILATKGKIELSLDMLKSIDQWGDWEAISIQNLYPEMLNSLRKDPRFRKIIAHVHLSRGLEKKHKLQSSKADPRYIAVLPFTEYSHNKELASFAEGIQNDLLTKLSGIEDLKVISGDSVRHLSTSGITIPGISKKLGAGTIIKGGVQQIVERIRLNVQMIDANNEQIIWAETYDRKLTAENLFNIQSELAAKIAVSLKAELTPYEKELVDEKPTENLEAYLHYSQGRSHLNQRTERSLSQAVECFQNSLTHDKKYAQAWAGLAEALLLIEWYDYDGAKTGIDAMQAAIKALSLNPKLAEAHATMGILYSNLLKGPDAIREFETAVELQPSFAEAYSWLGWMLTITGKLNEAIEPAEKSVKLDPHSTYTRTYLGVVYLAAGDHQKALKESMSARSLQPDYGIPYYLEGLALYHLQRYAEAKIALKEALTFINPEGALTKYDVLFALALIDLEHENLTEVRKFQQQVEADEDHLSAGLLYARMNDPDRAFGEFYKIEKWRGFPAASIRYFYPSILNTLKKDDRYTEILKNVSRSWDLDE